jgi:hypothetical protein
VAVLGFPAGPLAGHLDFVLALGALVTGTFAGRHPVLVAVVVKRSGGRGSSSNKEGSSGNERKESGFHGKKELNGVEKEGKEE